MKNAKAKAKAAAPKAAAPKAAAPKAAAPKAAAPKAAAPKAAAPKAAEVVAEVRRLKLACDALRLDRQLTNGGKKVGYARQSELKQLALAYRALAHSNEIDWRGMKATPKADKKASKVA